ncbi:lysozyme inhibitor LprI family protein [Massilia mucilaginosa]|uniref:lysozyme inhibitor LprI family protein n=1 Tax=Massilia mucilaginosa TaxID=2609282 RepID=UPI0014231884
MFAAQADAVETAPHADAAKEVPQFDAAEKCDQFSQAARHRCLTEMAADSAVTLKQAETKAVQMIDQWFENATFKTLAKSKLKASSTAFATYRQAKCAFADSLRGGAIGSAHEISRLACIADTNAQRALELTYATKDMPPP